VEYLNYLGSLITNYARCTRESKSRITMAKAACNKKIFVSSNLDLNLRRNIRQVLHLEHSRNTWKILECGAGEGWRSSVGLIV
jgi:hypothetical protein